MPYPTTRPPQVKQRDSAAAEYLPEPGEAAQPTRLTPVGTVPLIIPSALDELGLPLSEFRLVCHVARRAGKRGVCNSAIPTMSRICRMDPKTVKKAIRATVAKGILSCDFRPGVPLALKVRAQADWCQVQPSPKDTLGQKTPQGVERTRGEAKRHPTHRGQKTPHEGVPDKGVLNKGGKPPGEMEDWQIEKDVARLRLEIAQQEDRPDRNRDAMRQKRARLKDLEAEEARRAPPPKPKAPPATTRTKAPTSKPVQFGGVTEERWNQLAQQAKEAVK